MDAGEEAEEESLAAAILSGKPEAETLLYRRYHRQLLVVLRGRGVPEGLREDLAHEAYIVTLQRLRDGELEQPKLLGRYLKRTAINLWLNEMRKQLRRGDVPLGDGDDALLETPAGQQRELLAAKRSKLVQEILEELTQERDRLVLLLIFVYDWDKSSICDYVGIESRTFDNVRSRALQRCQKVLERNPRMKHQMLDVLEGGRND